jgi:hypothetical protein
VDHFPSGARNEPSFREEGSATVMEDRVRYAPPFGPLGRVANRLFIIPTLRRIFPVSRRGHPAALRRLQLPFERHRNARGLAGRLAQADDLEHDRVRIVG